MDDDDEPSRCQHCGRACKLLQCAQCHQVNYCSRDCQRLDWKAGHRKRCRVLQAAATAKATAAWQELQEMLRGLSLSEADEYYHKAAREVERLKQREEESKRATTNTWNRDRATTSGTNNDPQQATRLTRRNNEPTDDDIPKHENPAVEEESLKEEEKLATEPPKILCIKHHLRVDYVVEELLHTSCYQIRLTSQNIMDHPKPHDVEISTKSLSTRNKSIVTVHRKGTPEDVFLCLRLDGISNEHDSTITISSDGDNGQQLNIRIPMVSQNHDDFSVASSQPLTPASEINTLQCRLCQQMLITTSSTTIHKTLLLPSGNWDEITDYLSCYSGPSVIDFASDSTMARPGVALEDSSVLVLHQQDLGESLCALAVESYGQDTDDFRNEVDFQTAEDSVLNRGTRTWRNMVAGATLCCSQCCAPLGVASGESPETSRLWKHRLTTGNDNFAQHTVGTFLAHEMVRYAESKAVFTFVVVMPTLQQQTLTTTARFGKKPCLLLRLLRWDTRIAVGADSVRDENGVDRLTFQRVAKVIYEESVEPSMMSPSDVSSWKWGGVDLCCTTPEPFVPGESDGRINEIPKQSSVRICLPAEEWHDLRRLLKDGSKLFSTDVASAIVMVKIGKAISGNETIGLSSLPLI